jgi:alpha-tubulin suppressor-like RCC1 family protein
MVSRLLVVVLAVLALASLAPEAAAVGLPLVRDQVGAPRNFSPWLTARDEHVCAMLGSGAVRCWGDNAFDQLGDRTFTDQPAPVAVQNLGGVVMVSAGHQHSCALTFGGVVLCWGRNGSGQLGIGTTDDRDIPGVVALSGAVAVAAGSAHSCAVLSGGTVRCWGRNTFRQLGVSGGNQLLPVDVPGVSGAVSVVAGNNHTCVLKFDGTVVCWGRNAAGEVGKGSNDFTITLPPTPVATLSRVVALTAGADHTCAVVVGGQVKCWGLNTSGQLGNGLITNSATPVLARNTGVAIGVAAGIVHSCALRIDGTVICWGDNASGQLGDGTTTPHRSALTKVVGLDNAIAVTAGASMSCVLRANGSARCWGANDHGQLGDGTNSPSPTPVVPVGVSGGISARALSAGGVHACAIRSDGSLACWGRNTAGVVLGNGGVEEILGPTTVSGLSNVVAVSAGKVSFPKIIVIPEPAAHSCALLATGGVMCWGRNAFGELGDRTTVTSATPVAVSGISNAVGVAVGSQHTCAVLVTGQVRCWGRGDVGQLGNGRTGSTGNSLVPVVVSGLTDAVAVAAGGDATCALRVNGALRCWGVNESGQLGDGTTTTPQSRPVDVVGISDALAVTQSGQEGCVLTATGAVRCWGANKSGQLGNGSTDPSSTPVAVFGLSDAVAVSAGDDFACAARVTGTVQCWGAGGRLGDNVSGSSPVPVTVLVIPPGGGAPVTLPSVVGITAGPRFACALRVNGVPNCWGSDNTGVDGSGSAGPNLAVAVPVPSFGFNVAPTAEILPGGRRARVTALVDCPQGDRVKITITLEQGATQGRGQIGGVCTGQLAEYALTIPARVPHRFEPGAAEATAIANVWGRGHAVSTDTWSRRVTLEDATP